ncbi:MAG TPA: glycoside hydrolase family 2 TIM barrel-domain containing protein [Cyclobacteriaceae bacterium]|nr:glycoside hydrolase family 2 TIM barrel-domain containing protein [Cyclobacteriaceae bacterium]
MKNTFLAILLSLISANLFAQSHKVTILHDDNGIKLQVNGTDFMINGMNWDYFPIGTNYTYSLWSQPDEIIIEALEAEMILLKNMGVNVIRQYSNVPARWIQYIYEQYGIYTMLNHAFGRYGLTLHDEWLAHTDYANVDVKQVLLNEVSEMVKVYHNTPGLLIYLLGNENNYGLFWKGAETEDTPVIKSDSNTQAIAMYKLLNEAALVIKGIDETHPVAICNGDLQFLEIISQVCNDLDILGTNMYRGLSFGDAFQRVKDELNMPILFTEFGADAFSAINMREDQATQATYNLANWKEIYANAYGMGKVGNAIGGFTFQFSDGWWKFGQTINLDVHDTDASWANGGYKVDYVPGKNNMNEEWFGICAKGETNSRGLYALYPRAAYHVLKKAHRFNPFAEDACLESLDDHFKSIESIYDK